MGSLKPHPCLSFWRAAASAEQTPLPWLLLAQQAEPQSALATQPPVMNCEPLPRPTFLAPARLGCTRAEALRATSGIQLAGGLDGVGGATKASTD